MSLNHPELFHSNGFTHEIDYLMQGEKELILSAFFHVASKYININSQVKSNLDIENPEFHKGLIEFRQSEPKRFGDLYDELKLNESIRSVFHSHKFISYYSKLLRTHPSDLYINGYMIRLDIPYDTRSLLDWHQDSPYY